MLVFYGYVGFYGSAVPVLSLRLDFMSRLVLCFRLGFYDGFSLSQMATLEQEGEEVVGQARCPFESRQSNVGLFAGERGRLEVRVAAVMAGNKRTNDTFIKQVFNEKDRAESRWWKQTSVEDESHGFEHLPQRSG